MHRIFWYFAAFVFAGMALYKLIVEKTWDATLALFSIVAFLEVDVNKLEKEIEEIKKNAKVM